MSAPLAVRLVGEHNIGWGNMRPGDMWWVPYYHGDNKALLCPWDNCDDPRGHLFATLPDGWVWELDSRASNCGSPGDRQHRCWVRHGEPPALTVDKAGATCPAGAGSIQSGRGWHGFLRAGKLVTA